MTSASAFLSTHTLHIQYVLCMLASYYTHHTMHPSTAERTHELVSIMTFLNMGIVL